MDKIHKNAAAGKEYLSKIFKPVLKLLACGYIGLKEIFDPERRQAKKTVRKMNEDTNRLRVIDAIRSGDPSLVRKLYRSKDTRPKGSIYENTS